MPYFLLFVVLSALLLSPVSASAKNCRTEASCFTPKVTWNINKSGHITDVCHNYGAGHWQYRKCMMEAQKLFKERCKEARDGIKKSQGKYREAHQKKANMYCSQY